MMRSFQAAALLVTSVAAMACGESSPTAPSSIDATGPVASTATMPTPAPVSQTLTGTWTGNGRTFTVTQNGASASGMIAPRTVEVGNNTTLTRSTIITGTVSDVDVVLQMDDRFVIRMLGTVVTCTAGHAFAGALAGNTLSGTIADTSPLICTGAMPELALTDPNGPVVYTRQ